MTRPADAPAAGLAPEPALFFSVETRDAQRTAFTLDSISGKKFVIATGASVLTLILATVLGPLQEFLGMTQLTI